MGNFFRSRVFVVMLTLFIILAGIPTILYSDGAGGFCQGRADERGHALDAGRFIRWRFAAGLWGNILPNSIG